ncbi:ricin B lectin domain-containing protein [Collybia nuda]|uniref:Ricin B lectin domain-containing protein n=1 Tax=Collybia nuda TaxID=64659 RepID=A0A9P5YDQ3_9AGAR|nr:ricin B lectin domain-containing protein [Collybia nuda]
MHTRMYSAFKVTLLVVSLNLVSFVRGADLRACASQISNPFYDLVSEKQINGYIQCDYSRPSEDGGTSGNYCFYYPNYTLTHYPNTPLPVDSSADCPVTMPLASNYLIKTSTALPGQRWTFQGSQIRMGNLCMDVTNGSTANGARLQVWTCSSGNANQQFAHSGGNVLDIPTDRISWAAHSGKCIDLTDGSDVNGNQIQMWDCGASNPNQAWTIAVTRP